MTENNEKWSDLFIEVHPGVMDLDGFLDILAKNDYSMKYASFDNAVRLWKVTEMLLKKGRGIPVSYEYQSLDSFRNLIQRYGSWCPHVFFDRI